MKARIYQPARNAMQSGQAASKAWVLEFTPETPRRLDPLMGWTGGQSTGHQVKMRFESKDAALAYAKSKGLEAIVLPKQLRKHNIRQGGYGENFAANRRSAWTH